MVSNLTHTCMIARYFSTRYFNLGLIPSYGKTEYQWLLLLIYTESHICQWRHHMGRANRINILRPGPPFHRRHLLMHLVNEKFNILNKISLKFVSKGSIDNKHALGQIMTWCQPGYKALSEPMMVSLSTHVCVTQPQWVKCIRAEKYVR